jgi:putative ABC transport system permease protein
VPEWRARIAARLAGLQLAPGREAEIVLELEQHLDDRYRELCAAGAMPEEAERRTTDELAAPDVLATSLARVEVLAPLDLPPPGSPHRARWAPGVWQDVRHAGRALRAARGFTLVAVSTLALSTASLTVMLSVTNGVFLRPVPGVGAPHELLALEVWRPRERGGRSPAALPSEATAWLADRLDAVAGLGGYAFTRFDVATADALPRRVPAEVVAANFFDVLRVTMASGRGFVAGEDRPGAPRVVVISATLAHALFGDGEALGRRLRLGQEDATVVGVAPAGFYGPVSDVPADLWAPGDATHGYFQFVVRAAAGRSFRQVDAQLTGAIRGLGGNLVDASLDLPHALVFLEPGLGPTMPRARLRFLLSLLVGVAAVLLLIGCANVSSLLLFRGVSRRRETALRKALGASAARLAQYQLVESLLLAMAGAAAGTVLAVWWLGVVTAWLPAFEGTAGWDFSLDWRVLGLLLAVTTAAGLLAGIGPAVLAARGDLNVALRRGYARQRGVLRGRRGFPALQLALSFTLLVGALLLMATLARLARVDYGFNAEQVTVARIDLRSHGYDASRALGFLAALLPALDGELHAAAVSASQEIPFASFQVSPVFRLGDDPMTGRVEAAINGVASGFFDVMRIPVLQGRAFSEEEANAVGSRGEMPAIVSESLARRLFGSAPALGQTVILPAVIGRPDARLVIIGVVGDARSSPTTETIDRGVEALYQPIGRADFGGPVRAYVSVRTNRPVDDVVTVMRRVAARIDPTVPLFGATTLDAIIAQDRLPQRALAWALGLLAAFGFLVAAVGLHGLVGQVVKERTREFGIRLAMGADRLHIARLVVRSALVVSALGLVLGLALALPASQLVAGQLFGVVPLQPWVYTTAGGALALVVLVASLGPALAATRVDPIETLRAE